MFIKHQYYRVRWRGPKIFKALSTRAWLIEFLIAAPIFLIAHWLWMLGRLPSLGITEAISYVSGTLPVLAISNALPMLGATAVVARYAISDKPAETLRQISEALEADAGRFYQERGLPLSSPRSFRRAMSRAPDTLTFFDKGEQLFTPRPNWDGVWFFPSKLRYSSTDLSAHELTYCAVRVVQVARILGRRKVALVGGRYGGTNGSQWFLRALKKAGPCRLKETMTRQQAQTWVHLAYDSLHYAREELEAHRKTLDVNEARETEFADIFCEYMKWLGFFHGKALVTQWLVLQDIYAKARVLSVPPSLQKMMLSITGTQKALASIAASNLPRRATAARVLQVRKGVLLPLMGTATTTLICLSLKPLEIWRPDAATIAVSTAYSLIAASLAANFTFGLWLLLPSTEQ